MPTPLNRNLYWRGSTANDISSLNFNNPNNWLEYRYNPIDKFSYWLSSTPTPSPYTNGDPKGISAGATMGGAPSYTDTARIGQMYPAPTNPNKDSKGRFYGQYLPSGGTAWAGAAAAAKVCVSPCLYGGFSGSVDGGTWVGGANPTGTTFTSALTHIVLSWAMGSADGGGSAGTPHTIYPFQYLGTGITGQTLEWLKGGVSGAASWPKGWSGSSKLNTITDYSTLPLAIKSRYWWVCSAGTENSVVKAKAVKNWTPWSVAAGVSGNTGAYSEMYLWTGWKRSGSIIFDTGSYFSTVYHDHSVVGVPATGLIHNHSSENITFRGATLGTVKMTGSPNTVFDETTTLSNLTVGTGYYNGPIWFKGSVNTGAINNELYRGTSGMTGGVTAGQWDSITVKPLITPSTLFIRGIKTGKYGSDADNAPYTCNEQRPTIYIGNPAGGLTPSRIALISVAGSDGVNLARHGHTVATSSSRWAVKMCGEVSISMIDLLNAGICATNSDADHGDGAETIGKPNQSYTISTLKLAKNSSCDFNYMPGRKWMIGAASCGFSSAVGPPLGIVSDSESTIQLGGSMTIAAQYYKDDIGGNAGGGGWIPAIINAGAVNINTNNTQLIIVPAEPQ